jgi:hypothetical protein
VLDEWLKLQDTLESCQKKFREMMIKDLDTFGHFPDPAYNRTYWVMQNRTMMGHFPTTRFLNGCAAGAGALPCAHMPTEVLPLQLPWACLLLETVLQQGRWCTLAARP